MSTKPLEQFRYAGIGSRETPPVYLKKMTTLAWLRSASFGAVLRSGNAQGADSAFQEGAYEMEVYLPWPTFQGGHKQAVKVTDDFCKEACLIVAKVHPNARGLSRAALALHARNAFIMLGRELNDPVKFVLYWNPIGKKTGGTHLALSIAKLYGIPTFNLNDNKEYGDFTTFIKEEQT